MNPKVGDQWQLKSTPDRVATVIYVRDGYVRFTGYWLKHFSSGKAMDSFLAHYDPVKRIKKGEFE